MSKPPNQGADAFVPAPGERGAGSVARNLMPEGSIRTTVFMTVEDFDAIRILRTAARVALKHGIIGTPTRVASAIERVEALCDRGFDGAEMPKSVD